MIVGSGNLQAGNATMGKGDDPALAYLWTARNLLPGIKVLAESGEKVHAALALSAAQALECALKAFLSRKRVSEKPSKIQADAITLRCCGVRRFMLAFR